MDEFFTNWGPAGAPILERQNPPALSVFRSLDAPFPAGVAFPVGHIPHRRGPATLFRLAVEGVDPDARFVCVDRRFVEVSDAAESI